MSIDSVVPSNHLILSHPLLLHSIFPIFGVFSNEPALLIRVLELQLQHQFFQRVLRVDFLWIDWFDLLAVQGTLLSLLQGYPDDSVVKHLPAKAGDLGFIPDLGRSHLVWSS